MTDMMVTNYDRWDDDYLTIQIKENYKRYSGGDI